MRLVPVGWRRRGWLWLWLAASGAVLSWAATQAATNAIVVSVEGGATLARSTNLVERTAVSKGAVMEFSDRLRTEARSRAAVQLADLDVIQVNELSEFELLPPRRTSARARLDFRLGKLYFLDRTAPREIELETATAVAGIEGTEFHLEVQADGTTILTVFEGVVQLASAQGIGVPVIVTNNLQGIVAPGLAPVLTPVLDAASIIQWCLYYPGVLDEGELELSAPSTTALAASLTAYRAGNLLRALALYPAGRNPPDDAERLYLAGVLLSVGKVEECQAHLASISPENPAARALRTVLAAVQLRKEYVVPPPSTAGEFVARSYWEQSQFHLEAALADAVEATRRSPAFGFAQARVADLEFSFGRTHAAGRALAEALALSPQNAQAHVLSGFVAAARGRIAAARGEFEQALALDSALGNAWLGRGLMRIQQGDRPGARADLRIAAAREPNRSLLRSYLGKAWADGGDPARAHGELARAVELDPRDPTPLLYRGLLLHSESRVNEAVRDLEASVAQNDNRQVFRSRLLLDQDQSVRSANLATLYLSAGLTDVSVREAARAVADDYGNYSAHLFLSESYDALRDPTRFNLRYETVWFSELLLANLLSPVGAGVLPQHVSQQEYSRLLESSRTGLSSSSEYTSDGQFRELGSQFGTVGPLAWSFDVEYQHNEGVRANNDLDRLEWYSTVKLRVGPDDTALLLTKYQDFSAGDGFQYFRANDGIASDSRLHYRFDEIQHPLAVAGWHHEWQPGVHTLFLGGRLENRQDVSDLQAPQLVVQRENNDAVRTVGKVPFDLGTSWQFEAWTAELNQIVQTERQVTVVGARAQSGDFNLHSELKNPGGAFANSPQFFSNPPALADGQEDFSRTSAYAYSTWELFDGFRLTGGVSADQVRYPANFRSPPLSEGVDSRKQIGPKAALVWDLAPWLALRGAYAQSLGGVTFDETFRLEPTQLAGFSQAFRTLAAEAITSSVSAPEFEILGLAFDLKPATNLYAGLELGWLRSEVARTVGVFDYYPRRSDPNSAVKFFASDAREELAYDEQSVRATVNKLVARDLSLGIHTGFTRSELDDTFPNLPLTPSHRSAELLELGGRALFNHPSGFFTRLEGTWYQQRNFGYGSAPEAAGDAFPQVNVFVGWRLARRRVEITLGGLNLTGGDYQLNPLNPYREFPRERVFYARLRFTL